MSLMAKTAAAASSQVRATPGYLHKSCFIVTVLALATLMPVAPGLPRAEAAFPGHNGRIAIPVVQAPYNLSPEYLGLYDQDLFTVAPNGGALRRITRGVWIDSHPSWSPNGRRIVFMRFDPPAGEIYVVNADGTGLRNLTNTPAFHELQPAWSPDGERIVFSRRVPGPSPEDAYDLYIMELESGDVVQLTAGPGSEIDAEWSPYGRWIAFSDPVSDQGGIGLIRPDGSGRQVLVPLDGARGPSWSPDGTKIVFAGDGSGSPAYVVNIDGSGLRSLSLEVDHTIGYPVWSPDGRWITFISDRDGAWRLYKMRLDGSNLRRLSNIDLRSPGVRAAWGPRP